SDDVTTGSTFDGFIPWLLIGFTRAVHLSCLDEVATMTSWSRRRLSAAVAILFVIVAAMFAFFVVRSRLQEPATVIVYLKDVPYCDFLGHVVQSQGRIRLVKEYPLWDDDPRDGIWSARCWVSPMEKINFAFDTQSSDRHGIIMYSFDSRWLEHQPAT